MFAILRRTIAASQAQNENKVDVCSPTWQNVTPMFLYSSIMAIKAAAFGIMLIETVVIHSLMSK